MPNTAPPVPPLTAAEPLSRQDRKEFTRNSLMQAALSLMSEGRSFTSLGIREIAREASMVPNAFYRHFRTTDELGVALVDEVGVTLRQLLREARQPGMSNIDMVRRSLLVYHRYVQDNRVLFLFIAGERAGGSRALRTAIRNEVRHFVDELAQDMRQMGLYADMSSPHLRMICELIITTMLSAVPDMLDLPAGQPKLAQEMVQNFVQQLQIIFLGANHWRDKPSQGDLA
jgi:AcrR family transcriptional regulator